MIQKPLNHEAYLASRICKEITNAGQDTPDGLYSEEIFGITREDRVRQGAMFNLKTWMMRPNIVLLLKRFSRIMYNCVTGAVVSKRGRRINYVIIDGVLYREDDMTRPDIQRDGSIDHRAQDSAGVGPVFLYNNWHKLNFNKMINMSDSDGMKFANVELRKIFTKYKLNEIFQKYIYIIPIGYRENPELGGRVQVDPINEMYSEIIGIARTLQEAEATPYLHKTKSDFEIQLQMALINFYQTIADRYLGVNGALKKKLIARTIDGSARMVILPNTYSSNIIGKSKITIDSTGIPIHHLVAMFRPFVIKHAMDFVQELQLTGVLKSNVDESRDISLRYGIDVFTEMIENMEDIAFRVSPFMIHDFDGSKRPLVCEFELYKNGSYTKVTKELSNLEFFYIVLIKYMNITGTRTVATTRYPVDSITSIQTLAPVPLTLTGKLTKRVKFMDYEYDDFPFVDDFIKNNFQEKIFEQAQRISPGTATAVSGDFDGDTMLQKPLLTVEATEDAKNARNSLLHTFTYGGNFKRDVGKSPVQTLYSLTREPVPSDKSKEIPESHEFIQYILSLKDGELDLEKLYAYTRVFKEGDTPEISVYDTVKFKFRGKTIQTTVGRLILIKVIFSPIWDNEYFEYPEGVITADRLVDIFKYISFLIMENKITFKNKNPLNRIVDLYIEFTSRISTMFNASVSSTMTNPDEKFTKFRNDTMNADRERIVAEGDVDASTANEDKVLAFAKEHFKGDSMYELFISGGSANWSNHFRSLCVSVGATPAIDGGKNNIIIESLMDGVKPQDIAHTFNAGLTGAYLRGVASARAGDFRKRTTNSIQTVYAIKGDCGSTKGITVKTNDKLELLQRYAIVNGKSVLITTDNVNSFLGKEITLRSPFYCKQKGDNYCSHCTGEAVMKRAGKDKIPIGIMTSEVSDGLLNAYMKATHNLTQGISRITSLDDYIYGMKPDVCFEYQGHKVICTEDVDLYLSDSDTGIKPDNDDYNVYPVGRLVTKSGKSGVFTLGAFMHTKPSSISSDGVFRKFSYKKGDEFIVNTVIPKDVDTVYLMLKMIFDGKFVSGIPFEAAMKIIRNTMKLNQKIKASDISFEIILATLARDKNDQSKPARETGGEYMYVSTSDMAAINGTFTSLMSGDVDRGLIVNMSNTKDAQRKTVSPIEEALKA